MDTPSHARGLTGRIGGALVVCSTVLALLPAIALGSTVTISAPTLSYSAGDGEQNGLTVSRAIGGEFDIVDSGAVIAALDCTVDGGGHHVVCPSADIESVQIDLGDQNDELTVADLGLPPDGDIPRLLADGGAGNDSLTGLDGSDGLSGGAGDDIISGGGGADGLRGGAAPGFGPAEVDGADVIDGGPGDDLFIQGGPGDDRVSGGSGDDPVVTGGDGADQVTGGPGDDSVIGGPGDDLVQGGDGSDHVDVPVDGSEVLGRDTVEGGAGDDVLGVEGPGHLEADALSGGPGVDAVSYASRLNPLNVSLDGRANDGETGEGDNVAPDVEVLTGGAESDTLAGSAGRDTIDGGPGDDFVDGLAGDDRLAGGAGDSGSDSVFGGAGADTLLGGPGDDSLDGGADPDDIRGGGGSDTVVGGDGADLLAGGPGLDSVEGGAGDDTLNGGDPVLIGADGADQLGGGAGDDTIAAGPGNDLIDGGPGADVIGGEAGRDTVTYEADTGRVAVTFDSAPNDGERGEDDNVASDVERVIGSGAADTLTGDGRDNTLTGGSGEDLLVGLGGGDALRGGTAPDVVNARDGIRDSVDCGPARDLAILDRVDSARNCEFRDLPSAPPPRLRRTMRVASAVGGPAFRLPDARRFVPLPRSLQLPLGTTIDARSARVRLTTGRTARRRQTAVFAQGAFSVRQTRGRRPITDIRLQGGDFSACTRAGAARAGARKPSKKTVRRVWGKGRGHYRTRGRHSSGVVRGTTWLTVDRCDGTLTRVYTGTVVVTDFTRHRTVAVHAGERYLARAPRGG